MPTKTAPPSKGPVIVLSLLVTSLCLSIGAIAFIILFNTNRPTSEELTAACKEQVGGAISAEYAKVVKACAEEAEKTENIVIPDVDHPGFHYPSSWTAVGSSNPVVGLAYKLDVVPGFLEYCEGCDGPYIPIEMLTTTKASVPDFAKAATPKAYVEGLYTVKDSAESVTITEEKVNNATVIRAKGKAAGLYTYTFDRLYYFGEKNIVEVDGDQSADYKDGWNKVLTTIDFTKIE
jgi:hypothetical protein